MNRPRALHLFANFKWTGPADPAIRTAAALRRRGVDVVFAQAGFMHGHEHRMAIELRKCRMPVTGDLRLPKHYLPWTAWRDARVLARRLRRGDFDLLHANLPSDHLTASLAKRLGGGATTLVRSIHDPEAPPRNLRNRFAFANTDGVVVPTRLCGEQFVARYGLAEERVHVQEPTTDVHRFARIGEGLRPQWGVPDTDVLIGITARVQAHRRFPFLFEVARRVVDAVPTARFVLLGRGNDADVRRLVHEPIARHGLEDHVLTPGYLYEPEYSRALRSLDLFVFLVPGTDGTCRAVREAMAAGLPVVSTKRGILPELLSRRYDGIADEPCGILCEEDSTLMAAALIRLIGNDEGRANLRAAGLCRVAALMDEAAAARRLSDFHAFLREHPR